MSINVGVVGMIALDAIVVDDRAREEMGDLDGLEANMKESGLIAPLAVMEVGDGSFRLLAGERRYTVLKRNNVEVIPARIYDYELSEIEMKVIEKSENFYRKDMEYWELDKLTAEITRMQQELKGVKAPGPGQAGWGIGDTAEMLGGVSKAAVSEAIKRNTLREKFPDAFDKCKTASDASKIIKKMDEAVIKAVMAKQIEEKKGNKSLEQLSNAFVIRSFFEGIKDIPDGVFHLVEIDPPYAIDLKDQKKSDGESQYILEDYNEVSKKAYMEGDNKGWNGMHEVFKECYRTMAQHSWLICWFGPEPWFEQIYNAIRSAGFGTTRMCGIWAKPGGQTKQPDIRLANSYEMFFYAWKGQPALNKAGSTNLFNNSPVPSQQKVHPTERPVELMRDLYDTFAFPGSRVLIPFLGSGNGLLAAQSLGLTAMGFELSKGYKDSFLVKAHNMMK